MQEFYPFWPEGGGRQEGIKLDWKSKRKKVNLLRNILAKRGNVLDIGAGAGEFLSIMQGLGWQAYGIEFAKVTSNYAREKLALNVLSKDLLGANFESDFFDLITFWDVIEHLHKPKETLLEINRILKKEGLLVISAPNIDNLWAYIFKDYWYTNSPRHLYQFSPRTILRLLEGADFKVVNIIQRAGFFEPVGFVVTFKNWLLASLRGDSRNLNSSSAFAQDARLNKLASPIKQFMRLILEAAFFPFSLISVLLEKAPNMIIFARKC